MAPQEMRRHVLMNLLETEESYVAKLTSMKTQFYNTLKEPENSNIIEPDMLDEIFYKVPENS